VIARFLTGLMKAPRSLWHPVLVTLDEAHRYAPQSAAVESSEPIVNLATAGRKRGFGALFATQRLSQLSKDVLGQCPNRIMGRVDQSLDRRVAADTLGFAPSSPEAHRLMKLKHEFWVVGPAFAPEPRLIRFSPAVTTHLVAGHDSVPAPPTPEKLRALLGRLTRIATAPKAEPARNDAPGEQRQGSAALVQQAERHGYERGFKEGEAAGRAAASDFYKAEIAHIVDRLSHLQEGGKTAVNSVVALPVAAPPRPRIVAKSAPAPSGDIPAAGAMQLLMTAVTHWPVRFTWGQLATLNGRKARGGHFNTSRKYLAANGLVVERDGKVEPTDAAFEKTGVPRKQTPMTGDKILDMWLAALPSPAKDILQIVASHGGPVAIDHVAARLNLAPRGGHWNTGASMLRSNDLVGTTPQGFELGQALSGAIRAA
jgi:hypothetical protein